MRWTCVVVVVVVVVVLARLPIIVVIAFPETTLSPVSLHAAFKTILYLIACSCIEVSKVIFWSSRWRSLNIALVEVFIIFGFEIVKSKNMR